MKKLCNIVKAFDCDGRSRFKLPKTMLFYKEIEVKHCELDYLKVELGMQA